MLENREREIRELAAKAQEMLERAEVLEPRLPAPALRLWQYPSFEAYRSWTVCLPPKSQPVVREVTWDRPADSRRLLGDPLRGLREGFHTRPTVRRFDARMAQDEANRLLASLAALTLPLGREERSIVLDGTAYGLETSWGTTSVRLQWCEGGPQTWQALHEWTLDAMKSLSSAEKEKEHERDK